MYILFYSILFYGSLVVFVVYLINELPLLACTMATLPRVYFIFGSGFIKSECFMLWRAFRNPNS